MEIIGVVLAGGLSSRMKSDKSQLMWQGKTLLEYTAQLLIDAGCMEVLVSNNHIEGCIVDRYSDSGPLSGIEACLHHIQLNELSYEAMLIMPVDMPLMTVALLSQLCDNATSKRSIFYNLSRFPLILPINEHVTQILTKALESHQSGAGLSIKSILAQIESQTIALNNQQKEHFINCNTPQEWQNLHTN